MKTSTIVGTLAFVGSLSLRARAQECTDDADCDEGDTCQVTAQSSGGCDPGADGGCTEPESMEYRECEPEPLTCESDSDCAAGLSCVQQDDDDCTIPAGGPGGNPGEPICGEPSDEKLCALVLVECEDDDACEASSECVPSGLETCSSSPCAGEGPCNEEPICEPAPSANFCFPRQAACSTDDDCGEAEICYDVGELTDELPEWWDQDQGFEYCLPKGWGLAFDERVEIVADDLEGDSGVSRGESGTGTALDDADETDDEAKNTASGTGGGGGGGGCALAWTAAPGSAGALGLVLLVTFARTRRFRSSLSAST